MTNEEFTRSYQTEQKSNLVLVPSRPFGDCRGGEMFVLGLLACCLTHMAKQRKHCFTPVFCMRLWYYYSGSTGPLPKLL